VQYKSESDSFVYTWMSPKTKELLQYLHYAKRYLSTDSSLCAVLLVDRIIVRGSRILSRLYYSTRLFDLLSFLKHTVLVL
jgi:hypothetical protein